ncbi:MAG: GFA family protein [Haliea sp.]
MESGNEHHGACLCGAVRVTARARSNGVGACHCKMCRRWGGGPLLVAECESNVNFDGSEHIATFDSSDWAERGFCRECGTHLFYRLKQEGHYAVPVGLFDDDDQWRLAEQVFIDEKPLFYSFSQDTRDLTGEESLAQYAEEEDGRIT